MNETKVGRPTIPTGVSACVMALAAFAMAAVVFLSSGNTAEAKDYNLWVGSTRVTDDNKGMIPGVTGEGASASYDPEKKELTLKNVKGVSSPYNPNGSTYGIYYGGSGELTIVGDAEFTQNGLDYGISCELYTGEMNGSLAFEGKFKIQAVSTAIRANNITVRGKETTLIAKSVDEDNMGSALNADKDIIIKDGATVEAEGGWGIYIEDGDLSVSDAAVTISSIGDNSYGVNIFCSSRTTPHKATIKHSKVTITSRGGGIADSMKNRQFSISITDNSEVTVNAQQGDGDVYNTNAIYAETLEISDSKVTATVKGGKQNAAIGGASITVTNSTVKAEGEHWGINVSSLTATDSTVEAKATANDGEYSYGISAGSFAINGDTCVVKGEGYIAGIYSDNRVTVNGGLLSGEARATQKTVNEYCRVGGISVTNALTVNGGKASGTGFTGIYGGAVLQKGGTVTASGTAYAGLDSSEIEIAGGELTANGIYCDYQMTVSGGTVVSDATKNTHFDHGIMLGGDNIERMEITGGTLTASGSKCGIYMEDQDGTVQINGGTVSLSSAAAALSNSVSALVLKAQYYRLAIDPAARFKKPESGAEVYSKDEYTSIAVMNGDTPVYAKDVILILPSRISVTQASIIYGEALPDPVYADNGAVNPSIRYYSGTTLIEKPYNVSATPYTVEVTYDTDKGTFVGRADFYIRPADIALATVTLGEQATYDGNEHGVVIESIVSPVKDPATGNTVMADTDYQILNALGSDRAKDVGVNTLVLDGKGNFAGRKTVAWSLKKATPTVDDFDIQESSSHTHNGNPAVQAPPAAKAGISGMGAVTVKYKKQGSTAAAASIPPTDTGVYDITFDVAEGRNYKAATGLETGTTLTISRAAYAAGTGTTLYIDKNGVSDYTYSLPEPPGGMNYTAIHKYGGEVSFSVAPTYDAAAGTVTFSTGSSDENSQGFIEITASGANYEDYQFRIDLCAKSVSTKTISIDDGDLTKHYGDSAFTMTASLSADGEGTKKWSSGNTYVATIGETTGEVTIKRAGSAQIIVVYTEGDACCQDTVTLTVAPREVVLADAGVNDKQYDGTDAATFSGTPKLGEGVLEADKSKVSLIRGTAGFADKNVGADKAITYSGFSLSGAMASDYRLTFPAAKATITPLAATAHASVLNRYYNVFSTEVELTDWSLSGVVPGDDVVLNTQNAKGNLPDDYIVGNSIPVTVSGLFLSGTDAGNYSLEEVSGLTAVIFKTKIQDLTIERHGVPGISASFPLTGLKPPDSVLSLPYAFLKGQGLFSQNPYVSGDEKKLSFTFLESVEEGAEAVISISCGYSDCYDDYNIIITMIADHPHDFEHIEAVAPGCETDGCVEHWKCKDCGKTFADENGIIPMSDAERIIPALEHDWSAWTITRAATVKIQGEETRTCSRCGKTEKQDTGFLPHDHDMQHYDRVEPTETDNGNIEYWKCKVCDKLFADKTGTREITEAETVLGMKKPAEETEKDPEKDPEKDHEDKHNHNMKRHIRVEATEKTEGNIEYWECTLCGKLYRDEAGTQEITKAETVIAKLGDPLKTPAKAAPVSYEDKIGDIAVRFETGVIYPQAVIWTGSRITKEQLSVLAPGHKIANIVVTGLEEALSKMKAGTDTSKLVALDYRISSDKAVGDKPYFTVTAKLNGTEAKKAKLGKKDKKALATLIKKLNEELQKEENRHYFEIRPIDLENTNTVKSIAVKAFFKKVKKKYVMQENEDGTLKGLKSVTIKIAVPNGYKKSGEQKFKIKTCSYKASKAKGLFTIKVTDLENKQVELAAVEGTSFTGVRTGITVGK